ncbi:DJ-1/PfpI family protein [Crossiella cryophila]|uniref:Transcriptional regulator GlxA family with amidase domain n=1 Tax=Crossiella cryophila TaxID=43355 RepID=A0A7W7CDC3_9PSEU|nr:DJ-1/PfpI family protein [Crossiella cryophila]MBB4679092.1 transcriptional regulator GlxA family with amidase domain [Crossiella cryophila]
MLVQIVLFDGVDPLDALGPHEVFAAASQYAPGPLTAELVTVGTARPVLSGTGVTLHAQAALDPDRADLLIVPGTAGSMAADAAEITQRLIAALTPELHQALHTFAARPDTVLASVCGGSLLLGAAGLLAHRPAVTHRSGMARLADFGATAIPARVVDDGDLVTAGGVTSGLDLALHLVERFHGAETAIAVETLFEHERRGVVWRANAALAG